MAAIEGRNKIAKSQQEKLAQIEMRKKEALAKLNVKYATADKVKTIFGYIGIICLCLLWSGIILNDLVKLVIFLYKEMIDFLREKQEAKEKENEEESENVTIQLEDEEYSRKLEEKLDKVHMQLVKACAKRASGKRINKLN